MSASGVSFWDCLKVRCHLASKLESDRYLQSVWLRRGAPSTASLAAGLVAGAAVLAAAVAGAYFHLPMAALALNGFQSFIRIERGLGPPGGGGPPGQEVRGDRAAVTAPAYLFSPESAAAVQRRHDAWQEAYGDRTYREELKPRAVRVAVWDYVAAVLRFRTVQPPDAWSRGLGPAEVEQIAAEAEAEFARQKRGGRGSSSGD